MQKLGFKPLPAVVAVGLSLLIWFAVPVPEGVSPQAWHLLAMFVGVIAAIIGKAMPIGAVSIIAVMLVALTGVTADKPANAVKDALSSFSSPLIWLIGVAIMISRGILKTGLGARIGFLFISMFGKKTLGIGYSLALSELLLAPVTPSNTARGGGIIHPVMKAIASSYDSDPEKGTQGRIGKYLALVNYHSNPITSAMFITATAPNPLVVDLIAKATNSDIHLSWGTWALAMLLPGLAAMALMPLVLYFLYPPEVKETPNAAQFAKEKLAEMGAMSRGEKIMLGIFAVLLVLWAGVPAMMLGKAYVVDATTTAFIGLSLLLLTGVLEWDDILKEKSAWDTVTWFAALVMMATFLNKLGLIGWFSTMLQTGIEHTGMGWAGASALLLLAYMYAHYMFASTTAHITAMLGAFYTAGIALGAPPMLFALLMAAASSIMMTLTHYATGTSPVIFGSGYTTLAEWWKAGFIMSVVNLAVFVLIGGVWWKVLGYW
ncbi:DASS family sodium-coupled anion symporter [Neisseria chenwenguii]|uniref:C4-dicarboxylate ABC transporter n=1 Tax=Neisseria chenwenguii TaxID=1853278 RepID=A0A220S3L6_9NEIS|nr:DASS family sodium-coupled anion symporter [Neisseria chenwenguii]ASK28099.1 C4-dicarboxylate ABC transporter [Neisseria chenwenguii]ROV57249.1 DASS family sodium-coupled anion symporter [Neisseria chenwenguii]